MARNKPLGKKIRLLRACKSNRGMPLWCILKKYGRAGLFSPSKRRLARKPRNWRRKRLKL